MYLSIIIKIIFLIFLVGCDKINIEQPKKIVEQPKGNISEKAKDIIPIYSKIIKENWPTCPNPYILAGKIEVESRYNTHAELKTSREYGFGLGQITIAYNADGSIRMNNFKTAQKVTGMKVDWKNRFDTTFQLTYSVLTDKSNFNISSKFFDDNESKIAGMLVCYNAGPGAIIRRKALSDSRKWFGGLDKVHARSEEKLLYGKPLYERINAYPRLIIFTVSPKYKGWL